MHRSEKELAGLEAIMRLVSKHEGRLKLAQKKYKADCKKTFVSNREYWIDTFFRNINEQLDLVLRLARKNVAKIAYGKKLIQEARGKIDEVQAQREARVVLCENATTFREFDNNIGFFAWTFAHYIQWMKQWMSKTEKYWRGVLKADELAAINEYRKALQYYVRSSRQRPEEIYVRSRIKLINELVAKKTDESDAEKATKGRAAA